MTQDEKRFHAACMMMQALIKTVKNINSLDAYEFESRITDLTATAYHIANIIVKYEKP